MRVLFTTFAAKAHLYAQIPLAWALQTAGHQVAVASQPDLAGAITAAGLTAVPVGQPLLLDEMMQQGQESLDDGQEMKSFEEVGIDISETRPEVLTWEYTLGIFTTMASLVYDPVNSPEVIDDLLGFAGEWQPDLVVWDTMSFMGPVVAKVTGAAHARLLFGLDVLGRMRAEFNRHLAGRLPELRDDPVAEWLGYTLARYGQEFSEDMVVGQWTIDPVPPSMRFPLDLPTVPVRYIPYNGPSTVPRWLHEPSERPRVCLTLGLSKREVLGKDKSSIEDLIEAVADLDAEVVATLDAKQSAELSRVPENVRITDFVPLNFLLPTCAAVIHHGGAGTFSTALIHGVPQIFVPDMTWDVMHRGRALRERGAGVFLENPKTFTAEELRGHLVRVLDDPSFRRNSERLRREVVSTPSPNEIVPVLERLTAEYRVFRRPSAR
ncbi:activator-dependent family glycosyltransferase [Streptomyces cyaneofuscatus]|uniref:activator-dependent family glycosyltransferase n=1 Tax=Streptomyces cyaneofuscatus TaxID=66883 RepID=UPI0033BA06FA